MATQLVLYLSNLPFSITEEEVIQFLEIPPEGVEKIQFCQNKKGQPSGDCFVAVNSQEFHTAGLSKNSQRTAGETSRRITVTASSPEEMENPNAALAARREKWDGIIKVKGFPPHSTLDHVKEFLDGLEYQEESLIMPRNNKNESIGEAYVQFLSYLQASNCLERHKGIHGSLQCAISVFKTSNVELRKCMVATMKANAAEMGITQGGSMMGMMGMNPMQMQMQQHQMMSPTSNFLQQQNAWPSQENNNGGWPMQEQTHNTQNANGFGGPPSSFGSWNKQSNQSLQNGNNGNGSYNNSLKRSADSNLPGFGASNLPEKHSRNSEGEPYANRLAASNDSGPNIANGKIVSKPIPAGAPSKHLVLCENIPAGLTNQNIQEFFRPYRAIAVKLESNGNAMVAFKTHSDAEGAMSKDGNKLKESSVDLKLWSEKPAAIGQWGAV